MWLILAESDGLSDYADAVSHVLEAPLDHEAEPPCGVALALAKLAQHLDVNAIFPEFLFHTSPNLAAKVLQIIMMNTWA